MSDPVPTASTPALPNVAAPITHSTAPVSTNKPLVNTKADSLARVAAIPTPDATTARKRANREAKKGEMNEIHLKLVKILNEHDNKETDVPLNHEYWSLLNQYRGLR